MFEASSWKWPVDDPEGKHEELEGFDKFVTIGKTAGAYSLNTATLHQRQDARLFLFAEHSAPAIQQVRSSVWR
jgi:hypothetical protein